MLINSVRSRDLELDKLKKQNHKLQGEIKLVPAANNNGYIIMSCRVLKAERDEMITANNKMAIDMERLLTQSEVRWSHLTHQLMVHCRT